MAFLRSKPKKIEKLDSNDEALVEEIFAELRKQGHPGPTYSGLHRDSDKWAVFEKVGKLNAYDVSENCKFMDAFFNLLKDYKEGAAKSIVDRFIDSRSEDSVNIDDELAKRIIDIVYTTDPESQEKQPKPFTQGTISKPLAEAVNYIAGMVQMKLSTANPALLKEAIASSLLELRNEQLKEQKESKKKKQ